MKQIFYSMYKTSAIVAVDIYFPNFFTSYLFYVESGKYLLYIKMNSESV